jgi:hypothetical protein
MSQKWIEKNPYLNDVNIGRSNDATRMNAAAASIVRISDESPVPHHNFSREWVSFVRL